MSCSRVLFLMPFLGASLSGGPLVQETWRTGYMGRDANGPQVLGYWKFDAGAELKDSSGKGHDLTLRGAVPRAEGHSGQGLACGNSPDQSHSAKAGGRSGLTPAGAFTLEMWVRPDGEGGTGSCHLMDKRYTADNHADYAWILAPQEKSGMRRMTLTLGFGSKSESFHSEPVKLITGNWQHLAVTYDAAGTVTFYQNGSLISQDTRPGLGALTPGGRDLYIGDRGGSLYSGFPGVVDEVRLSAGVLRFESMDLTIRSQRHVWQRMEDAEPVIVSCANLRREPLTDAHLSVSLGGKTEDFDLPALAPGESREFKIKPDTILKPGVYTLIARLRNGDTSVEKRIQQEIVPRPVPGMPVILWGAGDIPRMKDIGFTHYMALGSGNLKTIWESRNDPEVTPPAAAPDDVSKNLATLDETLSAGMQVITRVSPRDYVDNITGMLRVDRNGKPLERKAVMALHPDLATFYNKVGRSLGGTYGHHPAMAATLVNTEVRDSSQPSFSATEMDAYRRFSGTDIPPEVQARSGVDHTTLKNFPTDRAIPDDDPILKYYRWFWTTGDGWNGLHSALSDGVKATAGKDHWTFFDPAVRQPSISGAGGNVDVLSQWTYTYPDPQRIGLAADQLFAMSEASGRHQRVMKMTQLIWYRSQTAPISGNRQDDAVPWVDQDPDAAYITIAPMHLREAFWTKLSRPISGIMYHGWQSLVPTASTSGYKYTNPNTVHVLKELIHDVVIPLGPTLMAVPDERADVVLLESFTSQIFSRRGGYGYNNGWPADAWLALQHAHIRTDILFEETLLKDGLDGRRILVMPDCDVLTDSVVKRIRDWQERGGKIIGDENLCPALKADLVLPVIKRTRKAADDRVALLAMAGKLATQVATLGYKPEVTADDPEVIVRMRRSGEASYVFAINDRREAGNYVGDSGLVLENGLPSQTVITLSGGAGIIHDLTRGRIVAPEKDDRGNLRWPVDLGPCDGRIFMILPEPVQALEVKLPESTKRGDSPALNIEVRGKAGMPLKAAFPLQVKILDANGREAEGSGYYTARDGVLTVPLSIASNEDPGTWEIRVTELASRLETTRYLAVKP